MSSFAVRLKNLRLQSRKSLQDIADAIGISKAHLWDLEAGKSKNPSSDLLKALSNYFNVTVAFLIGEAPEGEEDGEVKVMFRQLQDMQDTDREIVRGLIESLQKRRAKESDDGNKPN